MENLTTDFEVRFEQHIAKEYQQENNIVKAGQEKGFAWRYPEMQQELRMDFRYLKGGVVNQEQICQKEPDPVYGHIYRHSSERRLQVNPNQLNKKCLVNVQLTNGQQYNL